MKDPLLLSRRKALAMSATAAVVASQAGTALAASPPDNSEMLMFQGLTGQTFAMRHGTVTTKLKLVEVRETTPSMHAANARAPFSIILRGDDQHFESGMCELRHATLGTQTVFVHRVGLAESNGLVEFEAVFA